MNSLVHLELCKICTSHSISIKNRLRCYTYRFPKTVATDIFNFIRDPNTLWDPSVKIIFRDIRDYNVYIMTFLNDRLICNITESNNEEYSWYEYICDLLLPENFCTGYLEICFPKDLV